MTVSKQNAEFDELPDPININYKWTDIALRRDPKDVNKPTADQRMKLAVRCIGIIDGAESPMMDKEISMSLNTEELMDLNATVKTKIKSFIGVCEKGCAREGEEYVDDFSLAKG